MHPPLEVPAGTIFASDFRIDRPLARGGMGAVYVAHQVSTGRERALKVMHPALLADDDMRRRFEQEARIGSRIKSDHIVQVIAAGVDPHSGTPWLAMELLEGEDLGARVEHHGPMPLIEVSDVLGQICHALAAAHAVSVVHRDLKPENVFLSHAQRAGAPTVVKLLDLGIAKLVAEANPRDTLSVGTPLWMAPEQTGGHVGPETDVWALGLLTFWMLTARSYWRSAAPGGGVSVMALLREMVTDPIEPASVRAASFGCADRLPAGFDAWFSRCVVREQSERFQDAEQAHAEFARLNAGSADTLFLPSTHPFLRERAPSLKVSQREAAATINTTRGGAVVTNPVPAPTDLRNTFLGAVLVLTAILGAALWYSTSGRTPQETAATANAVRVTPALATTASASASATTQKPLVPDRDGAIDATDPNIVWNLPIGDSPRRGPDDAPVTVIEFANYQCPFSKGAETTLREIMAQLPGKVRLVWKDDPLAVHSQAEISATVAREARAQKGDVGFWAAHDAFLDRAFKPSRKTLLSAAKKLGLDVPRVEKAIDERAYAQQIARDADLADDFKVVGTPGFFVNGRRVLTTSSLDKLRAAIYEELERRKDAPAGSGVYESIVASGHGPLPMEIRAFDVTRVTFPTRGAAETSVFMVEFCDFRNFLCRLVEPVVDDLLRESPDLGIQWVHVPEIGSEDSRRAALAAHAAYRHRGVEGFEKMRTLLFEAQSRPSGFSNSAVEGYGQLIGFPRDEFRAALADPELAGEIEHEADRLRKAGLVSFIPAFLVCGGDFCTRGGYYLTGGQPRRSFEKRIRLVRAAGGGLLPATPKP